MCIHSIFYSSHSNAVNIYNNLCNFREYSLQFSRFLKIGDDIFNQLIVLLFFPQAQLSENAAHQSHFVKSMNLLDYSALNIKFIHCQPCFP